MALLTVQTITKDGITPSYDACTAGGDEFVGSGREFIHIKNAHTAAQTVTIDSQKACSQGFDHDIAVEVPLTNGEKLIGPFPKDRFNDTDEKVQLTYSGVTDLTIAIIRLP